MPAAGGRKSAAEEEGLVKSLKAIGRSAAEIERIVSAGGGGAGIIDGDEALWPAHVPALEAFLMAARQWRVAAGLGALAYLGLDYTACAVAWRHAGIRLSAQDFADFQVIEGEAVRLLNEPRERS